MSRTRKPPIDKRYMSQDWFIDSYTICSELREIYNVTDNEYIKKKLRVCATMAKAMANKLGRLRKGYDVNWKCQKCGSCCKGFTLDVKPRAVSLEDITLMEIHDVSTEKGFKIYIPHKCKHLTKNNLCDIWEDRPQVCRNYMCEGDQKGDHHVIKTSILENLTKINEH